MRMGTVTRMMVVFIIMITLSLGITGAFSYWKSIEIIETNSKESATQMLVQMKDSIDIYMTGIEQNLFKMSNQASVRMILNTTDAVASASQYDPANANNGVQGNEEAVEWMMKDFVALVENQRDIKNIYLATERKHLYSYPKSEKRNDYDPSQEAWYQEAVKAKTIFWTEPHVDSNTKEVVISALLPVYNNTNDNILVGVLGIDLSIKNIADKINNTKIGVSGYPVVTDKNRNIIIHKNNDLIGKPMPVEEINTAIQAQSEGYVDYPWNENGKEYKKYGVFSKMDKLGWTIITTMYVDDISKDTQVLLKSAFIIGAIALFLTVAIMILFSRKLSGNIKQLLFYMENIKQGDFTVKSEIKSNDEIGQLAASFNVTLQTVGELIKNAQDVSNQTAMSAESLAATAEQANAAIDEIAHAVQDIASGANQQAMELESEIQITNSLAQKIVELTKNTGLMLSSTEEATQTNKMGVLAIEELQEKTELNVQATNNIENAIMELSHSIKNIDHILGTITAIAEQTNLLALNAAIEAARAGEYGRGFAVVAEEIRKLAMGSADAVEDIKDIIAEIQKESLHNVESMKEVKERTEDQSQSVEEVQQAFQKISQAIDNITQKVESINTFVEDMNSDKDAIVSSMESISAVSEETSASTQQVMASIQEQSSVMEEIARAAENLNAMAVKLDQEIGKFKLN